MSDRERVSILMLDLAVALNEFADETLALAKERKARQPVPGESGDPTRRRSGGNGPALWLLWLSGQNAGGGR